MPQVATTPAAATVPDPFENWTLKDAQQKVAARVHPAYDVNRAYAVDGDHWQNRKGYIGTPPDPGHPLAEQFWARLEAQFTPVGAIEEVCGRIPDGLLKTEPSVSFALQRSVSKEEPATPDETELLTEANALLAVFWDHAALQEQLKAAAFMPQWAERSYFRLWWPEAFVTPGPDGVAAINRVPQGEGAEAMAEALGMLYVTTPEPKVMTVHTDPATRRNVAIFLDGVGKDQMAVLYYVDGEDTVVRVLRAKKSDNKEMRLPLGGANLAEEIETQLLITETVRAQQRQLDFASSLVNRLLETAAFKRTTLGNVQPAGDFKVLGPQQEPAPGSFVVEKGGKRFELTPKPRATGPGWTMEVVGLEVKNDKGVVVGHDTPTIHTDPGTEPTPAITGKADAYGTLLNEVSQIHYLNVSDGRIGWKSRKESRADFEARLSRMKDKLETAARRIIFAAFAMAEYLTGQEGRYTGTLRVVVDLHIDTGPPDPEEIDTNEKQVRAGLLSPVTAMARNGVEDVTAEMDRIQNSLPGRVDLRTKQLAMLGTVSGIFPAANPEDLAVLALIDDPETLGVMKRIAQAQAQDQAERREIAEAIARGAGAAPPTPAPAGAA